MKIWKKISLGFISVISIMIMVDYSALQNNIDIIKRVDDLELSKRIELSESSKIAYLILLTKSNLRELFIELRNESNHQKTLKAKLIINENLVQLTKSLNELHQATTTGYELSIEDEDIEREEAELVLIDSLTLMINQFNMSLNQILNLEIEKQYAEAEAAFNQVAEPKSIVIQNLINKISIHAQEEVDWAIRQLDEKVKEAIRLGIYFTILSILLSLIIGFYIARSISSPLNKLIHVIKQIREGNLEATVQLDTKGELQILADSFNNMAKELKTKMQSINKLNKELKESNTTKDTFFSIIGHDLKTPFNAILGFTNLLENQYTDYTDEERKKMIREVNKSASSIYELLENLLTWARSQSGKIRIVKENINLTSILLKNIDSYASNIEQKQIKLVNEIPKHLGVYADRFTVSVIINNVLNNAIKFTPNNGCITLSSKIVGRKIELAIKDTGVGMTKETIDHLFHAEESKSSLGTNNEIGTGLGLILIKEFIHKNGGQFWIKSELDKGTIFCISLPSEEKRI